MKTRRTRNESRRSVTGARRRTDRSINWVRLGAASLLALLGIAMASGCAGKAKTLQLSASIMYEKPAITEISHTVKDGRPDGDTMVVSVTLIGDPSLVGTFDISPGIAEGVPLREVEGGRYVGEYRFPSEALGGPYTVVGSLEHERAGRVMLRDPHPITISIFD